MFRISTRIRYGLRALLELSKDENGKPVNLHNIAEKQNISHKYLESIFKLLKNNNIVRSVLGPGGGYQLKISPDKLTLYKIIMAIDGPFSTTDCVIDPLTCENTDYCPARMFWVELQENIVLFLKSKTLRDIMNKKAFRRKIITKGDEIANYSHNI